MALDRSTEPSPANIDIQFMCMAIVHYEVAFDLLQGLPLPVLAALREPIAWCRGWTRPREGDPLIVFSAEPRHEIEGADSRRSW